MLNTIQQARPFSSKVPSPYVMLLHAALPAGDFSRMCHAAVTLCEEMFAGTSQRQGWARQCRALQLLVSVRVVRAIALHCPALKRFFARFQLLSDDVLQPLILRCPQLEELAMPWNLLLTDASISCERSYVVTTSTPSGRLACNSSSLSSTNDMAVRASAP